MPTISAYVCSRCGKLHIKEPSANKCCCCEKCGTPLQRLNQHGYRRWNNRCAHCNHGTIVREARADLRRAKETLRSAEVRLALLLDDGRPSKGS
jgi:hypothetical protein